jgi:hypothetical protein
VAKLTIESTMTKFKVTEAAARRYPNFVPILFYICIEQTGFTLHVTQYTEESTSESIACRITLHEKHGQSL